MRLGQIFGDGQLGVALADKSGRQLVWTELLEKHLRDFQLFLADGAAHADDFLPKTLAVESVDFVERGHREPADGNAGLPEHALRLRAQPPGHEKHADPLVPGAPGAAASVLKQMPKSVTFLIFPLMTEPTGYLSSSSVQGLGAICFMPRAMRLALGSMSRTTASTSSPMLRILEGCLTRLVQLISET